MPTPQPQLASALEESGLRYVTYSQPGISRIRSRTGFRYVDPEGRTIREPDVLARIQALAIPPAWTDVWICTLANGHLQAVGRDARRRRQYRYHSRWRTFRDATKFDALLDIAQALPVLRRRLDQDLNLPGLPQRKVLAALVWLLQTTLIRVGNEEYARDNQSFGLTTLQDMHAKVEGLDVRFEFRGKSGKHHVVDILDSRLAVIVRQCQELPGQDLFQYQDLAGERHDIASEDVNAYLHEVGGKDFSAKDFRTWMATVHALEILRNADRRRPAATLQRCVRKVAELLGNTPTICRRYYIHPGVIQQYIAGDLVRRTQVTETEFVSGLTPSEQATVAFLSSVGGGLEESARGEPVRRPARSSRAARGGKR